MTPEKLMIPRIKVMKDWPGRRDFEVGQVITLDKTFGDGSPMWEIEDCQGKRTYIMAFFKMFPAEFRIMEWWEERLPEEMPEYIRLNQITVCKVKKHFTTLYGKPAFMDTATKYDYHYDICTPATESEYNTFIESKK